MNTLLVLIAIAIIALLIFKSRQAADPATETCVDELISLVKKDADSNARTILRLFQDHQRTPANINKTTLRFKSRLGASGILKEQQDEIMREVRKAKAMLKAADAAP